MRSLVLALVVIAMSAASADAACNGLRCRIKNVRTKAGNVVRFVLPPYGR